MAKKLYWDNKEDIKLVLAALNKDEVLISSTDTIYGFLANITKSAWQKILELKQVSSPRPFLILISLSNVLDRLAYFVDISQFNEKTLNFINICWPGPVTFIFSAKKELPLFLSSPVSSGEFSNQKRTIALRCPEHAGLQSILGKYKGLFSTSANKSKKPAPSTFNQISQDLLNQIKYIVVDAQESSIVQSSTLIDISNPDYTLEFPFKIIRKGAYLEEKLYNMYNKA